MPGADSKAGAGRYTSAIRQPSPSVSSCSISGVRLNSPIRSLWVISTLYGAFGIYFKRQFAARSTQQFPIDQPFYAVLPNLPEPFVDGEILLTISPEGHPIVIRGTFDNLDFEYIAKALKAKYGTPMKASSRHIIHKVSGNMPSSKRSVRI